jgi:Sigma-70 region 2
MISQVDVAGAPEPKLVAAARSGDGAAFDRLVARHRRELYAHCYRMLGSVQDAEDAVQESRTFDGSDNVLIRYATGSALQQPLRSEIPERAAQGQRRPGWRGPDQLGSRFLPGIPPAETGAATPKPGPSRRPIVAALPGRAAAPPNPTGRTCMASNAKKKTTFAKMNRENAVREKRLRKQAKKDAKKQATATPPDAVTSAGSDTPTGGVS